MSTVLAALCGAITGGLLVQGKCRAAGQPRATCLDQPDRLLAPANPKFEIRNPKFREGGWAAFLIPHSSFLIHPALFEDFG